jgi:endonuclease/exonuclease/phosphatase family metal-dependent hydrolase
VTYKSSRSRGFQLNRNLAFYGQVFLKDHAAFGTRSPQCGKGCDGVVDLARIVSTAKLMADADVFCFQEVSAGFANLDGGNDQSAQLAALLPDHHPVFRPAVETVDGEGRTHRFGNMTLSRLPVLQVAAHLLPWAHAGVPRSMRRLALEVTVRAAFAPIRIVNTHL